MSILRPCPLRAPHVSTNTKSPQGLTSPPSPPTSLLRPHHLLLPHSQHSPNCPSGLWAIPLAAPSLWNSCPHITHFAAISPHGCLYLTSQHSQYFSPCITCSFPLYLSASKILNNLPIYCALQLLTASPQHGCKLHKVSWPVLCTDAPKCPQQCLIHTKPPIITCGIKKLGTRLHVE